MQPMRSRSRKPRKIDARFVATTSTGCPEAALDKLAHGLALDPTTAATLAALH